MFDSHLKGKNVILTILFPNAFQKINLKVTMIKMTSRGLNMHLHELNSDHM